MDPANTVTPSHLLETARVIPIAELCPDLVEPNAKAVGGVVTVTWPYNKVKGTFAFNLAEPDFRLRRNKGQVRIDFTGRAAKAVGDCGLGGNDEVLLSLNGAAWEAEAINKRQSLTGADLGWRLVFSESLTLRIKRAETNETDLVAVNEQPDEHETAADSTPIQPLAVAKSPSPPAPPSPTHLTSPVRKINTKKFGDSEFASPAFVRRARMSYGSLFEDGFDIFQDDGGVEGKGRKRTRFGRDSSSWRYTSQSPSPEPVAESPESIDEQVSSPTRAVSSPTKAKMADEGCQTMELDQSSPRPISTPPEAQTYAIAPEDAPLSDAPPDTPMDSATDQKIRTSPLKGWFSESTAQNKPTPNPSEVLPLDMGAPPPHPDQQPSFSGYSFAGNPWTMSMAPSAFEPQQTAPLPMHVDESFVSSGLGPIKSGNLSIPFDKPDSPGKTCLVDDEDQEPFDDGVINSTEINPSTIDYSSLEPTEDTHPQPIHDEALTNYPAIYLESGHMSQSDQIMTEQASRYPAVAELGSSSWTTVNDSSKVTAKAPTDRLRSRDGDTPEQAVVIDESDAESDSELEPMVVEDTVHNGRAYAVDMYEDAETEDEVDAQYSDDDDEPEYNADEMGGDYDTRNYEQPGDDDDDSLDEDLRPQPLDPEFDDGESWDEEEQEEFLDEENEGEYEMDEDVAEPAPQPAVRTNPTVIDLISSSEDEGEDEDEDEGDDAMTEIERSGAHINSRTSPSRQQITLEGDPQQFRLNDEESEIVSQASMSEAENSSEAGGEPHEYASSCEEEEVEYEVENVEEEDEEEDDDDDGGESEGDNQEEAIGNELELESCKEEEIQERESSQNQEQQHTELEIKSMLGAGPTDDALLGNMHNRTDISYRQTEPQMGSHESIGVETRRQIPEEGSAIIPLSAADGLEMLSRAVDKESNACSRGVLAESAVERVVVETISEQSPPELAEEGSAQMQDASSYYQNLISEGVPEELPPHNEETWQVDPTASSNPHTSHPSPIINKKELTAAAPSSPPLTQSFRSLVEDDPFAIEETAVTSAAQAATTQLPTPLNTQITDITLNASASTFMNIAGSFESYATIEQPDFEPREGSAFGKLTDDLAQQDSNTNTGQGNFEQERDGTPIMELQVQQSSRESYTASSPALSFQTQVDDAELTLPDTVEQPTDDSQLHRRSSSEHGSGASDTSRSFTSHMEIDEELQASILENSQLEESLDHDVRDENDDESVQIDTSEAVELEQPNQATIVPSLHEETPAKQLAEEISAQLKRNFTTNSRSSGEESDTSIQNDPSVHLARVANASRRGRKRAASTDLHRPRKRPFDTRRSPTPETDDSSIQFTRTSLASQTPRSDEDSYSMTAAKLQLARHLRDELPDCTSLKVLRQHLTKSLDVIAVAVMKPPDPQRAKGGPREFMMSFTISDYSIGPYAVAEALIYRPHRDTLPVIKYGDIVLLRNFTVVSLANKGFGLRTNEESSWAVFDYEGEPAQIKGPPVEYSERETLYVDYLREWFRLLDIKAREKLEMANQKIINAGKSK
ncbi:hypothetical protein E0Z10_g4891 [Xylaria hypoxylon]|uniref:Telomeric single stranded DNA binding POT1/Cdc13 domain-containing protein n=1 Tax=Xylaria hypoxylon TaxID=37992 RepID=A0A4Z0YWU8_9PEZI|nr:hypothetical protein E0Z10_g4891 [Xylaria hypoxylon]